MDFYQQAGVLVFGSRLRRLSETCIGDINKLYKQQGIDFEAAWFPVFYLLGRHSTLSVNDLAETLSTSHSAASQLVAKLQKKGLLKALADNADNRKKMIAFTARGRRLYTQIQPVWNALRQAMNELLAESKATRQLAPALTALEQALAAKPVYQRMHEQLQPQPLP